MLMSPSYNSSLMLDEINKIVEEVQICGEHTNGLCIDEEWSSRGYVVYLNYKNCSSAYINLPGINLLPNWLLGVMWALFLIWLFFGVAIISDKFVEAIEVITSKEHLVKRKTKDGKEVMVPEPIWNWAVANISLLAVGSSSPEILLSIVECAITINQPAGQIGPACIIGSGTYNLFGILAVCNIALPPGVIKKIWHVKVFAWTTTWSIWAHLWLWIVYKKITPDVIDVWEGFVTLGMFPIFVFTTWLVDTRGWPWQWLNGSKHAIVEIGEDGQPIFDDGSQFRNLTDEEIEDAAAVADKAIVANLHAPLTDIEMQTTPPPAPPGQDEMANNPAYAADPLIHPHAHAFHDRSASGRPLLMSRTASGRPMPMSAHKRKSVLYYRHLAVQLTSGTGHHQANAKSLIESSPIPDPPHDPHGVKEDVDEILAGLSHDKHKEIPKVLMKSSVLSVLESTGEARVKVLRMHGDKNSTLHIHYTCKDDTALAGLDYQLTEGVLVMGPGEESKEIVVKILDDDMSEPDVHFEVQILSAEVVEGIKAEVKVLRKSTVITIVDDDDGGILMFELPTYEAGSHDPYVEVVVTRRSGSDGTVGIEYVTKDVTAMAGKHFTETKGTLTFATGEVKKSIRVPILPFAQEDVSVRSSSHHGLIAGCIGFKLLLTNPSGGVVLGSRKECRVVFVPGYHLGTIAEDQEPEAIAGEKGEEGKEEEEEFRLWAVWQQQFEEAILPGFDKEEGGLWTGMALHYVSSTFKLIAACMPPPEFAGGYPTLLIAVLLLAGIVFLVEEVAKMLGCAMGLSELMTGLSVVALGTSLPDTFGSMYAAILSDSADEAVGNIMGSNSANVLLGLGIPWVFASLYYKSKSSIYAVTADALGFSIMVFNCLAVICVCGLMFRRFTAGGELGGKTRFAQWMLFFFFVSGWIVSLVVTGLYDYGTIPNVGF